MNVSPVEKLFSVFNETADVLQQEKSYTFLEALAETGENLFHGSIQQRELSEPAEQRLKNIYEEINLEKFLKEEIRKAFQLVILKGMKENVQANHQMTPDTIGMLLGYLVGKFVQKPAFRLLDPAVGTGNLLTTVLNYLSGQKIESIGVEIDDILIKLAYANANLQEHYIHLFNQDSLEPLFIEPVDVVISDLPVGYYSNDARAADFQLKANEGHSYAHHLFIEQCVRYTKPGGYLFFMVPNGLFDSAQAPLLHEYIKENLYIQGFLQLPLSLFKNNHAAKSLILFQKKGEGVRAPKEALLVQLPNLSNAMEMKKILVKIDSWFVNK